MSDGISILCGDSKEILKGIESNSIQLLVTSPPYNLGKSYEKKSSLQNYVDWIGGIVSECVRVVKDDGSICWQVGNYVDKGEVIPLDIIFYGLFKKYNLKLRNRIIWSFGHGLHCSKRFSGRHETILWFTKSDDYKFNLDPIRIPQKYPGKKHFKGPKKGQLSCNPLGKNPGDVWAMVNVKHGHPEKTNHPCQFPEELVKRLVLSMTDKNDIVLDPFAGSGTTGKVCLDNNRQGVLIEKELQYIDLIKKRLTLTK